MTAWVDGGRAAWGIRVQPYDVITYDIGNGKRAVGQVGDVYSHVGTGGRITEYHVHGVDFGNVIDINNGDDPQLASPELTAEFKAQRAEFNRRRNAPVIERGKAPSSAHQVPRSSFDEAPP